MQGKSKDVIFTMDLKKVLAGADVDGKTLAPRSRCEDDADFENWTASDESGAPECILGKHYTWHRVTSTQRATPCFLPKDYELPIPKSEVRSSRSFCRECSLASLQRRCFVPLLPFRCC